MKKKNGELTLGEMVTEITLFHRFLRCIDISVDYLPISCEEEILTRPDVTVTRGWLTLRYDRSYANWTNPNRAPRKFRMSVSDVLVHENKKRLGKYSSWFDLVALAETEPIARFILHNSGIAPIHFDIAYSNPTAEVPFGFNAYRYLGHVGEDTDFIGKESILFGKAYTNMRCEARRTSLALKNGTLMPKGV